MKNATAAVVMTAPMAITTCGPPITTEPTVHRTSPTSGLRTVRVLGVQRYWASPRRKIWSPKVTMTWASSATPTKNASRASPTTDLGLRTSRDQFIRSPRGLR